MCCFSQPVELVADTNIFARGDDGRQFLAYSMSYAAASALAMVLPLPVPPDPPEDAVRFIDLKRYPSFFDHMRRGFPQTMAYTLDAASATPARAPKLRVHAVGDFEASFVPRIADFDRLDERFRIPPGVWQQLPGHRDYGFAVFKLKASVSLAGDGARQPRRVHPMAFTFPRRDPDLLFFPTVHVHDRQVHPRATFDHMLYCQADPATEAYLRTWERSHGPASTFLDVARCQGLVQPHQPCRRLPLRGSLDNRDTLVGQGGTLPR
ncbi:MAG: hypothetical protein D6696_21650 [Acidobacteria bacterium]|nr:MAG: hypothetical protein D6696_21650 [Acidobacteriota bacterium]